MLRDSIQFQGKPYIVRLIDFGKDRGKYYAASTLLLRLLLHDDCSYTSDEARYVDELIFYFIPTHYFKLLDDNLRDKILSEI